MSIKKYLVNDIVFDDDNWQNHFLPIITSKLDEVFNSISPELVKRIENLTSNVKNKTITTEKINELIKLRSEVIEKINAIYFTRKIIEDLFCYKDYGIISNELIYKYKQLQDFDWTTSIIKNNYISSWGIFNNHLIINCADQEFRSIYKNKKNVYRIFNNKSSILFTNVLPDLNFILLDSNANNKGNAIFENKKFASRYFWRWSDDVEVLMFFTPWFQEQFTRVNKNGVKPQFNINKAGSFIYNDYQQKYGTNSLNPKEINYRFINIYDLDYHSYLFEIKKLILNFIYDKYCTFAFATIIPIINSNLENKLIQNLKFDSLNIDINKNANNLVNYIIYENQLVLNNPFTEIDDYDMYYGDNAITLSSSYKFNYHIIDVYRARFLHRFLMEKKLSSIFLDSIATKKLYSKYNWSNQETIQKLNQDYYLIGHLVLVKVNHDHYFSYGDYYTYSNFDKIKTFRLEMVADKLKELYGCEKVVINNGYLSFISRNKHINDEFISTILKIINS